MAELETLITYAQALIEYENAEHRLDKARKTIARLTELLSEDEIAKAEAYAKTVGTIARGEA